MSAKRLLTFLKLAVSAALVAWLLGRADLDSAWSQIRRAHLAPIAGLFASVLFMNAGQVLRWLALVRPVAPAVSFWTLAKYHMIAIFFQSFLPSAMAVEVVKGYQLAKWVDPKQAYGSVVFGKVLGFAVLLLIVGIAGALRPGLIFHQRFTGPLVLGTVIFALLMGALFSKKASRLLSRPFRALPGAGLFQKLKAFRDQMYAYRYRPRTLFWAVAFSAVIYLGSILACYYSFSAVSLEVPFIRCMVYMPVVFTLMLLPVSINGIGVREGLLLFFFRDAGLTEETLISSSALVYGVIYGFCLTGGGIYFLDQMKRARRDP